MKSMVKLLLILGGIMVLIGVLALGTSMLLDSGVGDQAEQMRQASGTDELRAMGCSDATVLDLNAVEGLGKAGDALGEDAKDTAKVNVTCVVGSEQDAPRCEEIGEAYVKAVPDAPAMFNVSVLVAEGESACAGLYEKASGVVKSAVEVAQAADAAQKAEAEPAPPPPPSGVSIELTRKGMLFVDEEKVGRVRKHELELEPGEHSITVKWNKKTKVGHTLVVEPFKHYTVKVLKRKVKVTEKDVEPPPAADAAAEPESNDGAPEWDALSDDAE